MKTIRKIAALLVAAVLLLSVVPSAFAASSSTFSGTHWYAESVLCDYIDWDDLDPDSQAFLKLLNYAVDFVPYESWLQNFSICSIYIAIDFYSDGTVRTTCAASAFGQVDWDSYTVSYGTWSFRDGQVYMKMNGSTTPLTYRNGRLIMNYYGVGLNFAQG